MLALEQIDRMAGRGVHNGVVANVSQTGYADFDEVISKTEFVLILDGITDPHNFGAILRVADGFGVGLVGIPEHDSVGLRPAAIKASAGATPLLPIAQAVHVRRADEKLDQTGFWAYGTTSGSDPPSALH